MHAGRYWKFPLSVSLCLCTSVTYADDLDSRVSTLETKMAAIKTETVKKTTGVQFAPGGPQYDGYGLYATADVLFWHLYEGGTDYALSYKGPLIDKEHPFVGDSKHAYFDWDFGFRAGLGYTFEHDGWDANLNFTWFQTDASNTAHQSKNGALIPEKGEIFTVRASTMKSDWDIHYYVLDLELGRRFFVSKFLSFRPQFGVESAWLCQRRSYVIIVPEDPNNTFLSQNIYGKNNFWGIGPKAGFDGTWYLGRHFSILGSATAALLWGRFDVHEKETVFFTTKKVPFVNVNGDFHTLVPNAQAKLGIGWDANVNKDKQHLGISLFYEFQYWWRQNQFINENFEENSSFYHESMDLSINGLTLDVRFDF